MAARIESMQLVDNAIAAKDMAALCALLEGEEGSFHADSIRQRHGEIMGFAPLSKYKTLLNCLRTVSPPPGCDGVEHGDILIHPPWCEKKLHRKGLLVDGSLVALAVALDRSDILRFLLQTMHYAAEPFHSDPCMRWYDEEEKFQLVCVGSFTSGARPWHDGRTSWDMSPLAFAILLGHSDCAELLLHHGAATEAGNDSVSHAMYLSFRMDDPAYRRVRELVLAHGDPASHKPFLAALPDATLQQFRAVLKTYRYDVQDCAEFAEEFHLDWDEFCLRLRALGRHRPSMWGSDAVAMRLITHACCCNGDLTPLLPQLKNRKLDLRRVDWDELPEKGLRQVLSQLSACCTLFIQNGELGFFLSATQLRLIMKYVCLINRECDRRGRITNFTFDVLSHNNPRLLRYALQTGHIRESTKDILTALQEAEIPLSASCRAALLTTKRNPALVWEDWDSIFAADAYCFPIALFDSDDNSKEEFLL